MSCQQHQTITGTWDLSSYDYPGMLDDEPYDIEVSYEFSEEGIMTLLDANGDQFETAFSVENDTLRYELDGIEYVLLVDKESHSSLRLEFTEPFPATYFLDQRKD